MKIILNLLLTFFLLTISNSVLAAEGSYLEELGQAWEKVEKKYDAVHKDGGTDGMTYRYLKVPGLGKKDKSLGLVVPVGDLKKPSVLIMPEKLGGILSRGSMRFALGKKTSNNFPIPKNGAMLKTSLIKNGKTGDSLQISPEGAVQAWIGEQETIDKIWDDYFVPMQEFRAQVGDTLAKKYKISPRDLLLDEKVELLKYLSEGPQATAKAYAEDCSEVRRKTAKTMAAQVKTWAGAEKLRQFYFRDDLLTRLTRDVTLAKPENIMLAMADVAKKFPERNARAASLSPEATLKKFTQRQQEALKKLNASAPDAEKLANSYLAECKEVLLANPLLDGLELLAVERKIGYWELADFERFLKFPGRDIGIKRAAEGGSLGAPTLATHSIVRNFHDSTQKWNCEIVKLSNLRGDVKVDPLFVAPPNDALISNIRLNWDGKRVAFTMGERGGKFSLYELDTQTGKTEKLSPKDSKDHYVDSCYLPDGNMLVMGTGIMTGLPCEGGSHLLSNMYILNPETKKLRQIGIDQENSYHATVRENGRVMYVRYEYTDTPHYFTRVLMEMNPDGTDQRAMYGTNSAWPTSIFYPQQIPGKPHLFSTVVSGHHGPSHMGRLVLFDVTKGRHENEGAVQFIGEKEEPVDAIVVDRLYMENYPKHMYSVPLDAEYYITTLKPAPYEPWGLYLVDRFDNRTPIYQNNEDFIAWPMPYKPSKKPPQIPSRIDTAKKTSTLYIQDVYHGPGLEGVPRGEVKELAVFSFHYGYKGAGGHSVIGVEGPWDARYLLGTVPVNEDGSAIFEIPALMPVSLKPLDKNGVALQHMRSWINAQPGEVLSCVGCHESVDDVPIARSTQASQMEPSQIKPWFGMARPYSFQLEVQPVLDKYCVGCHNGEATKSGKKPADLRNVYKDEELLNKHPYSPSYLFLQKYIRRQGPEGNYALTTPTEWIADSSKLIQMLKKGHCNVKLSDEAWRRLYMWIDLNAPYYARWYPNKYEDYGDQATWRADRLKEYAGLYWNPEQEHLSNLKKYLANPAAKPVMPQKCDKPAAKPEVAGFPFTTSQAKATQKKAGDATAMSLTFGKENPQFRSYEASRHITKTLEGKEKIDFVRIPAGKYVMGGGKYANEKPQIVTIAKPFWMSTKEITNRQFSAFDPMHDSRFADRPWKDQSNRGEPLYGENQPVVRVSYQQATAFCEWLSKETGKKVKLPTEQQWEWAARAGTDTATWFTDKEDDFGKFANLSDKRRGEKFASRSGEYFLYDADVDDKAHATAEVGKYRPNPWGLYDVNGNVEEWTSSTYEGQPGTHVVRGGSWSDLPKDATSSVRWGYRDFVRLPDLGFRVIVEE